MTSEEHAGHGEKMTRKQDDLLAALLTSPSVMAAAKKAGVSESSARRWMKLSAFAEAYRDARREGVTHAIALLQRNTHAAVAAILRNLSEDQQPAIQLRAAELALKFAMEGIELEDLAARIEELEARFTEQQRRPYHAA